MDSPSSACSTMSINSMGSEILQGQSGSLYLILTPYSGWQWVITPSYKSMKRSSSNFSNSSSSSTRTTLPETPAKRKSPPRIRKLKKRRLEETTTDLPAKLELFSDHSTVASFVEEDNSSRESWPVKNELAWLEIEPLQPGEEDTTDLHCSEQLRCESPGLEGFVLE